MFTLITWGSENVARSHAAELRYETLQRLEEICRLLVDHYGARMTLGELHAIIATLRKLCRQDRVSVAEIADATGLPKQNISRWMQKRLGDSIYLRVNEDDQRMRDILLLDSRRGQEFFEELAVSMATTDRVNRE
jgi:DNA-binding transcriptional ArsR family regulator